MRRCFAGIVSFLLPVAGALLGTWAVRPPPEEVRVAARVPGAGRLTASRARQLGLPLQTRVRLVAFHTVDGLSRDIAQFESVFWETADTQSLRAWLQSTSLHGKTVLEIGTGTGLVSLCCLESGAERVIATDINPAAVANAAYNAELLGVADRLDLRWVSQHRPGAFEVVGKEERFDLILSNPPWEDGTVQTNADYAFYDPGFLLLESLLKDLRHHLAPDGICLLAYGCKEAILTAQQFAEQYDLSLQILDDRRLSDLPENFLPGMLLAVRPKQAGR